MALGIGHFAVGATLTALVLWVVCPGSPYRRSATLFGGAWAMVPDAGKIDAFAASGAKAFHDSTAANVFWAHHYIDVVDPGDSAAVAAGATAAFLVVSVLTEASAARRDRDRDDQTVFPGAGRPARSATARSVVWLRRLVATAAIGAGGVLGLLPFVIDSPFVGILAGTGAVLGLLGLEIVDEDRAFVALAGRVVPRSVRVATRVGVSVVAGLFAAVLLSRVPPMTELSVPYGALGLVLVVLLLRLWLPPEARVDRGSRVVPGDRAS